MTVTTRSASRSANHNTKSSRKSTARKASKHDKVKDAVTRKSTRSKSTKTQSDASRTRSKATAARQRRKTTPRPAQPPASSPPPPVHQDVPTPAPTQPSLSESESVESMSTTEDSSSSPDKELAESPRVKKAKSESRRWKRRKEELFAVYPATSEPHEILESKRLYTLRKRAQLANAKWLLPIVDDIPGIPSEPTTQDFPLADEVADALDHLERVRVFDGFVDNRGEDITGVIYLGYLMVTIKHLYYLVSKAPQSILQEYLNMILTISQGVVNSLRRGWRVHLYEWVSCTPTSLVGQMKTVFSELLVEMKQRLRPIPKSEAEREVLQRLLIHIESSLRTEATLDSPAGLLYTSSQRRNTCQRQGSDVEDKARMPPPDILRKRAFEEQGYLDVWNSCNPDDPSLGAEVETIEARYKSWYRIVDTTGVIPIAGEPVDVAPPSFLLVPFPPAAA
ncbi:hypothetical protein K474DRAFT_1710939 [Panus rudis PR-1116 ss-1]|nr:hypothetical protein K474DRAFT_1710939 [Panus rudis PR-1116 ss-1]